MELQLYKIAEDIAEILGEEEWTEDTEKALESLSMALDQKADNCAAFVKNLEAFASSAKKEEDHFAAKRKAAENRIDRIKKYVKWCMEQAERSRIEVGARTVKIQKNSTPSLIIEDESEIPGDFWTVIPATKQLDRKGLTDALKKGKVKGARIEYGSHLRIS